MTYRISKEFKSIAFDYDEKAQPFFKAIVKENLRKIRALPHGAAILNAIAAANPAHKSNFPKGVNVVIQPPITRQWHTPGLNSQGITDQAKYDAFQAGVGKLIPGIAAKTSAQEVDKGAAKGGGTVCWLFFSNNEIISGDGKWLPPHMTMGHELIHCVHALYGQTKANDKDEEWATVGIKGFENETYTENKLRANAGIELRLKYFHDD